MKLNNQAHSFCEAVHRLIKMIPYGMVSSYGDIARGVGYPGYARAVAYCLRKVPPGAKLPWFRVLRSDLSIAMPPDSPGAKLQRKLLRQEGVMSQGRPIQQRRWQIG